VPPPHMLVGARQALELQRGADASHSCAADKAQAEKIKAEANDLFKRGRYNAAADRYTEALAFAPEMEVLFVNRALCHRKLEHWQQCEEDARRALSLHSGHMKARSIALRLEA
jgi:tetratricopeptide (TPR) repeat protein